MIPGFSPPPGQISSVIKDPIKLALPFIPDQSHEPKSGATSIAPIIVPGSTANAGVTIEKVIAIVKNTDIIHL